MNIRQYVSDLSSVSLPNVFNPYKDICEHNDHVSSPAIRRLNLELYLAKLSEVGVDSIWLGRDCGYRGGRRTGIALTDEVHLEFLGQRLGVPGIIKATLGPSMKERTATEIWKRVAEIDLKVFLWNVFPFHPFENGEPMSNRRHSTREFSHCRELLSSLLTHLKPRTVVALGADLIIFGPDQPWRFNFLDFKVQRKGRGAGLVQNLVNLLVTIAGITKRNAANGGGQDEGAYWEDSKHELLRNLIDLIILAKGSITVSDLYDVLSSAPTSVEQTRSAEWKRDSVCSHYLIEAYKRPKTAEQQKDFEIVADFWLHAWPGLAEKTRSIVASTFRSMVDVINRGVLRTLFCGETNLTPQAVEDGRIVVIDLPVKEFADVGQYAAAIFKYAFQMSISRRDTQVSPRPVFLWQDEAQHFVLSTDSMFQSTCRSYKVATVLLTQNVSGFYAAMGHGSEPLCDSLWANLNTKIFHANGDQATNKWAAETIGRVRVLMANSSSTRQQVDGLSDALGIGNVQTSAGISEIYEFEIQPSFFVAGLKTGGPDNHFLVESLVFRSGVCFRATGRPYLFCTFSQK